MRLRLLLLVALTLLLLPEPVLAPQVLSLVKVERARAADAGDDVVWVLALGSDARPGTAVLKGNADAIQLVGMNFKTGNAVAIGIPRDSWVEIPGQQSDRINSGLKAGGPQLMATLVEKLVGFAPDYVLTSGFNGFADAVDTIGGVVVRSDAAFEDPERDVSIARGPNQLDGQQATNFARSRKQFVRGDFVRSANQQVLLRAILQRLRQSVEHGNPLAIAQGALAVARGMLQTDLSPVELYRLAHAVAHLRPARIATCVLDGYDKTIDGKAVIIPDRAQAIRLGTDAREDATFESGC